MSLLSSRRIRCLTSTDAAAVRFIAGVFVSCLAVLPAGAMSRAGPRSAHKSNLHVMRSVHHGKHESGIHSARAAVSSGKGAHVAAHNKKGEIANSHRSSARGSIAPPCPLHIRIRKTHPARSASLKAIEPVPLHPDYQERTRKLEESYRLQDRAWNDQVENNYPAAVEHLQAAVALSKEYYGAQSPLLGPVYLELAATASTARMPDIARRALSDCARVNGGSAGACLKLALSDAQRGNIKEAVEHARIAAQADPGDPRPHLLLGLLFAHAGQKDESRVEKERARELLKITLRFPRTANTVNDSPGTSAHSSEIPKDEPEEPALELP